MVAANNSGPSADCREPGRIDTSLVGVAIKLDARTASIGWESKSFRSSD
jgi:hypothetical protein